MPSERRIPFSVNIRVWAFSLCRLFSAIAMRFRKDPSNDRQGKISDRQGKKGYRDPEDQTAGLTFFHLSSTFFSAIFHVFGLSCVWSFTYFQRESFHVFSLQAFNKFFGDRFNSLQAFNFRVTVKSIPNILGTNITFLDNQVDLTWMLGRPNP